MGRPEIEIDPAKVEALAAQGLTHDQICSVLGVNRQTLYRRKTKYSEFSDAISRGRARGIATITNALFQNAKGGNLGAQTFYLKNRDRDNWRDQQDQHVTGDMTLTIETGVPEDGEDE